MNEKPNAEKIYPRTKDFTTVYLKNVITNPNIIVGDFTMYNDFCNDPKDFQKNNVLYHYPYVNNDKLIIGKFCSIACNAKFIFNSANHTLNSLSTYPFPIFQDEWDSTMNITEAWDNKGDIVIGNDVWIGYDTVIMSGVHIGDGAIIGTRALVTKDVPPYAIVGGVPAKVIRKRFEDLVIDDLLKIKWWDWSIEKISEKLSDIRKGNLEKLKE
ncbi:CatB-related O-acetyltransferase [Clostridium neuense]|uniref:CatB-related O-acetyltransferase n=1 Tax=Clostridium neuense TaxID=1728934 RepID=A0ABW8TA93_9CLOT